MAQQTEPKKDSKQVVVELTMTLEEARQTIWQGTRAPRKPMGEILPAKQLDSSDLAWAVDCGFDPKFREAARTLLAHWLGQPATLEKTLRYGPQVIEGSHYLEDKELENLVYASGFIGLAVMGSVVLVFSALSDFLQGKYAAAPIAAAIVLLLGAGIILFFVRLMKKRFDDFRMFRTGRLGEEKIVERLRAALDNRWTIFRNLHLPGHADDIDIVLVGPGGVWAVEVKSSRFTVRIEGKKWELQVRGRWITERDNPSDQITITARLLNDFLKRQAITRWVERAIALASPQPISNFDLSEIPVWLLPTIEERVDHLSTRIPPTEKETQQIVAIFKDLAAKQIATEEAKYQ